ncbi:nucleotide-binding protein [Desulfovibrio sp. JY]|nr:nucleotide-binding protein [Desulfovibrio sp. JY]
MIGKVDSVLRENSIQFERRDIQHGVQFRFPDGAILNVFDTGKTHWAGKPTSTKEKIEKLISPDRSCPVEIVSGHDVHIPNKKVFIVYGHDTDAREQLELLLRRLQLEPVVLQNLPAAGETVIEKLESNSDVHYACVLLTPDDQGHAISKPDEIRHRARQNVVLELGMFLASLGRKRVAILHKGDIELPSDISGLLYIRFSNRIDEIKERIAAELQEAGFTINIKDLLS